MSIVYSGCIGVYYEIATMDENVLELGNQRLVVLETPVS